MSSPYAPKQGGTPNIAVKSLPNAVTALALCCGLISIRFAIEGHLDLALGAIVASAILDGLDGRLARRFHVSSQFGAEFDSLADFLSFGVAPIVLLYFWSGGVMPGVALLALAAFALASAMQLARFNVKADEVHAPWRKAYFTGMPTPSAALAVLLPVSVANPTPTTLYMVALYTAMIAALMVSTIPTFSGKGLSLGRGRRARAAMLLAAAVLCVLVFLFPRQFLVLFTVSYLASIPVSIINFRHDAAAHAADLVDTTSELPAN